MNNKQDKGFTLVELLIVIVILGILATVTVFAVRGITDRGQENACAVDQRTLDTASRRSTPSTSVTRPTRTSSSSVVVTPDDPVTRGSRRELSRRLDLHRWRCDHRRLSLRRSLAVGVRPPDSSLTNQ